MSNELQSLNDQLVSSRTWRTNLIQTFKPKIATFQISRYLNGGSYSTSVQSPYNYYSYYIDAKRNTSDVYNRNPVNLGAEANLVHVGAFGIVKVFTRGGNDFLIAVRTNTKHNAHLGAGNDFAIGGWQSDTLRGEDGDDFIDGAYGDDLIYGGAGNDTLCAGPGNDTLNGGTGKDRFVFFPNWYRDGVSNIVINDFSKDDIIDLMAFTDQLDFAVNNEIRIIKEKNQAVVTIDMDNDKAPDIKIRIEGMDYNTFKDNYTKYIFAGVIG